MLISTIWVFLQFGPVLRFNPLNGNMMRNYFWGDQMAYLSISAAGSAGFFKDVEPFTETGRSVYPSGFYAFVGWFSNSTNTELASALNFVFLVLSVFFIILIARALQNLFDSKVAAFAVLAPMFLGTLNTLTTHNWSFALSSHAVIWPMAAGLYAANAESLGLLLISLMSTYLVSRRVHSLDERPMSKLIVAAVILGILANSHTYAFFMGMTIAIVLLLEQTVSNDTRFSKTRKISIFIYVTTLFATTIFILSILNVVPLLRLFILWLVGLIFILYFSSTRRERLQHLAFFIISAVVAAPQVIKLAGALLANDAFLTSRQQVSSALSVPIDALLFRYSPLCLLVICACIAAKRNQSLSHLRVILLLFFVWLLLSLNQTWGLQQEPYRFAIGTQVPLAIYATAVLLSEWKKAFNTRRLKFFGIACAMLIAIPSTLEVQNFWLDRANSGVIQLNSAQFLEMRSLAISAPPGLLLPDPCIEPSILKVVSRKEIASYSKGLAWPANVPVMEKIASARSQLVLDLKSIEEFGITSLIVDKECPTQWANLYANQLKLISTNPQMRFELYAFRLGN